MIKLKVTNQDRTSLSNKILAWLLFGKNKKYKERKAAYGNICGIINPHPVKDDGMQSSQFTFFD